jgi:hypothetical protein
MSGQTDLVDLADELADIAGKTTDGRTGEFLMDLVHRLWTEAGLEPDAGGGEAPGQVLMEAA